MQRLGPFRQAVYTLVYTIENRSRLIAVNNIRKNKTELVIYLFIIFISFFMQEMDKDVIHIYVTIALFCLSFVMISISLVIFFKFRYVHRHLINYADTALCMKKCLCWLLMHILNLWRMHTKKEPNGCKNFKFNCTNLSFLPKYFRKLKIKLLKLKTKWIWNTLVCKLSYFCLISSLVLNLIRKSEKLFLLKKKI